MEREFRVLKGIAEGAYNTKHAEAARLYYTTILLFYYTSTLALNEWDRNDVHERVRAESSAAPLAQSSRTGTRRRSRR